MLFRSQVDGIFRKWDTWSVTVSPTSSEIAPGLLDLSKFEGMHAPTFYALDLLVKNEDGGSPLSDKEIVEILSKRGIPIARRTVAKYRTELNILPSNMRRKY